MEYTVGPDMGLNEDNCDNTSKSENDSETKKNNGIQEKLDETYKNTLQNDEPGPDCSLREIKHDREALLTQVEESDSRYEQYTIYPINDTRVNDTSSNLYQMVKVRDVPLSSHMQKLDPL